jgi:hypothetical protein
LHDGFERVAEIVRQRSEFLRQFRGDFVGGICHGYGWPSVLQMTVRGEGYDLTLV